MKTNLTPAKRVHPVPRRLLKKTIQQDTIYLGRRLTRDEVISASFMLVPLRKETSNS